MGRPLAILAYTLVWTFLLFIGVLMFASPQKYLQFLKWWTRTERFSSPTPELQPALPVATRIGGLVFILGSLLGLLPIATSLLESASGRRVLAAMSSLFPPVVGLALLVVGVLGLLKPRTFTEWAIKSMPHRVIATPIPVDVSWLRVRLIAAVFAVGGLAALLAWLNAL